MKPVLRRFVFRGFTLIELAIVLVIVSLMTGFGMKAVQTNRTEDKCYEETRSQLRKISSSIDNFVRMHGVYPRPAMVNAGVTNTTFGTTDSVSGTNISHDTGNKLWFGALPFSALGLSASYAADCWGNKFIFIVTKDLTIDASTYASSQGQINIKTGALSSSSDISTKGAYAVISRGESALSPCQKNFQGSTASCFCNAAQANAAITRVDKENCDTNNATIYVTAFNNGANAPNYFDDLVIYKEKAATSNASCVSSDVNWGNTHCTAPVGALASTASTNVTNSASGYTGSATVTCNAGQLVLTNTVCTATVSGCNLPWGGSLTDAQSATAYASATPSGPCASETRTCTNGTLSGSYTAQACTAGCAAAAQTWLTNCGATPTAAAAGAAQSITNTAVGYSGSATATCNAGGAGTWALSGTSCTSTSCTLPWGGSIANGASTTAYLTTSPSGSCTSESRTCTNGTLSGSYTNQTCTAGCAASTQSWSGGCSGPTTAMAAGGSQTASNTTSGYSGSVTATCNAGGSGAIAQSGASCTEICNLPWGGTINSGQGVTAYSSAAPVGTCVSETRNCVVTGDCSSQVVGWSKNGISCSGTADPTVNGASAVIYDDTGNIGSCTSLCTNGTFGACSPKSCIVDSSSSSGCFLGETLVTMADGSTKPIAELEVGDKVRSGLNPNKINTITKLKSYTNRNLMYGINGSKAFVTAEHQFRGVDGSWKAIDPDLTYEETHGTMYPGKLMVGDKLIGENGTVIIVKSIDPVLMAPRTVYNPTLDGDHTYFANGYAVHNEKN